MPTHRLQRRQLLQWGLACSVPVAATPARGCEFFTATLRVIHPWTRATAEGQSSAVVCMKFDDVQQDDRLIGVECEFAGGAELGGLAGATEINFPIPKGQQTQLSEGGVFLRLLALAHPLEVARSYPIRLRFEQGGLLRADLSVDYARFL